MGASSITYPRYPRKVLPRVQCIEKRNNRLFRFAANKQVEISKSIHDRRLENCRMRPSQQNKRFRSALFYTVRDFHNRQEIAAQSCKTDGGRFTFKQLSSDIVINRAVENQMSFV